MTKAECVMYLVIGKAMVESAMDAMGDDDDGLCDKIIEAIDFASRQITLDLMADYAKELSEQDGDGDE